MIDIFLKIILDLINSNLTNWLTLLVLTATLIAVIRYTVITDKLQKTAENQTKETIKQTYELIQQRRLSILPSLFLDKKFIDFSRLGVLQKRDEKHLWALSYKADLSNLGNGIALNISVEIINNNHKDSRFIIQNLNMLKAKTTSEIGIDLKFKKPFTTAEEAIIDFEQSFLNNDNTAIIINLNFQDIEGNRYVQENILRSDDYYHGAVKPI
ncbi:MAG: hypothetical protein K8S18_14590 [Desulfobacula sp.]|nr:hypothetical protein [Desulfobacula sp.]